MSNLGGALCDILAGGGSGAGALLHNCRFEGAGASAYGREGILELFRAAPLELAKIDDMHIVCSQRFAALFGRTPDGSIALFADVYDQYVTRLWYLAPRPLLGRRIDRVDVPFDPTLGQQEPCVGFDPADHKELFPMHIGRVTAVGSQFLVSRTAAHNALFQSTHLLLRPRPFVLRAFSDGESAAALFWMVALRRDGRPGLVQFSIAALISSNLPADATLVVDEAECQAELQRTWQPAL